MASGLDVPQPSPASRLRATAEPNYCNVERRGRIQPTYANSSFGTGSGLSSAHSGVGPVSSNPSGLSADRVKQMEDEIHLLRMSVSDKDTQLNQLRRDLGYSHDQIKQLNVLLAEKKESILSYQERISDMQTKIGDLRESRSHGPGEMQALPEVMAARHANEALQVQMAQLRAQLAEVNRQNNDLRTQNRELSWQVQQLQLQQRPPLRATSSEDSPSPRRQSDPMRDQKHVEAMRENQMLRSRVELLTHQVATYNEDFKAERADRERAQTKLQEQKEEVASFKQMIVVLARDHGIQLDPYGLGHLPEQLQ